MRCFDLLWLLWLWQLTRVIHTALDTFHQPVNGTTNSKWLTATFALHMRTNVKQVVTRRKQFQFISETSNGTSREALLSFLELMQRQFWILLSESVRNAKSLTARQNTHRYITHITMQNSMMINSTWQSLRCTKCFSKYWIKWKGFVSWNTRPACFLHWMWLWRSLQNS